MPQPHHDRGKGQARRKKIVKRPQQKKDHIRLIPILQSMKQCISRINTLIHKIEEEHDDDREDPFEKFYIYLQDDIVVPSMMSLYRDCFIKKEYWKELQIAKKDNPDDDDDDKDDPLWKMWASHFWNAPRAEMQMPENLDKYTQDPGYHELYDICMTIEQCLHKKEWNENKSDSEDESERVDPTAFYKLFEIDETEMPTRDYLVRKYRRLSLQYHPDRHPPDERDEWSARFKELCFAYKWLTNKYV